MASPSWTSPNPIVQLSRTIGDGALGWFRASSGSPSRIWRGRFSASSDRITPNCQFKNALQNIRLWQIWGGGSAKDCTLTILETFEHISDNINLIINHDTTQGKKKVRNCSKFGEKIKVASKCKQRRQYCQNIGPWWYSSCFNAKWSPKQLKHSISVISHWFSVERVRKGPKLCKRKRVASRCKNS